MSDLHTVRTRGLRALLTRSHLCDVQIAIGAPARISQLVPAAMHEVAFSPTLDALFALNVRRVACGAAFRRQGAGHRACCGYGHADAGAETRHERVAVALSARTFGAEEAQRSLDLASRVAPCLGAGVRAAIVELV